jgi:hypothetical protein
MKNSSCYKEGTNGRGRVKKESKEGEYGNVRSIQE